MRGEDLEEDLLRDVPQGQEFWFNNGVIVRNIYELHAQIKASSEELFSYHCGKEHDDFSKWISSAIHDDVLSERLSGVLGKEKYAAIIERHIAHLEHAAHREHLRKMFIERLSRFGNALTPWIKGILLVGIIMLLIVAVMMQYQLSEKIEALGSQVNTLKQSDTLYIIPDDTPVNKTDAQFENPYCITYSGQSTGINDTLLESVPSTVSIGDINVYDGAVVISINSSFMVAFTNTSSMLPVLNHNTKAIEVQPKSQYDLHIGDIISYTNGTAVIVHRIIDIRSDTEGTYYVLKGDNNAAADLQKVRFSEIKGKVIALIY